MKTLRNLFLEELADRYDGEKQLVQAMPKMAEAAIAAPLKKLINVHLKQTELHVTKLEKVFKAFGEKPNAKKCQATIGLLNEGAEIASSFKGSPAIDAALISSAQKIEHYEIASYGCLREWARVLGNEEAAGMLQSILDEENGANELLINLACSSSNNEALAKGIGEDSCCEGKNGNKKDGNKAAPIAL